MTPSITAAELRAHPPSETQWIDVRSPSEFAVGHIPGAINIPMDQIESRLDDLRPGAPLVLICQMGARARMTAALLEPCRSNLTILEGGTAAWIREGLPIVANVRTRWSLERQVRFTAGLLILLGAFLAFTVHPYWLFLSAFVGLGLTFAGLTDICPMGELLQKMPWNGRSHCKVPGSDAELSRHSQ